MLHRLHNIFQIWQFFNEFGKKPKCSQEILISEIISDITIMNPSRLISKTLMNMLIMCTEYMIIPWKNMNIYIILILSRIDVFNCQTQYLKQMYICKIQFQKCFGLFGF